MKSQKKNSAWLFAFSDLAFLLLISLSLIPSAPPDIALRLSEMKLPEVPDSQNLQPVTERQEVWELQVLQVTGDVTAPFRLKRAGEKEGMVLDEASLIPALEQLQQKQIMPVVLPEKTSLSQDFLFAAAALAKVWSSEDSRTIVRPLPTGAPQ
ncbi:MAG: hypothetical protein ACWGOL_11180 [Desulfuromonadales bacterium]